MHFKFEKFDARSSNIVSIIDEDTGKEVGYIKTSGSFEGGGIDVHLFGEKYTGCLNNYHECVGFVKGVETALKRITRDLTEWRNAPHLTRDSVA